MTEYRPVLAAFAAAVMVLALLIAFANAAFGQFTPAVSLSVVAVAAALVFLALLR